MKNITRVALASIVLLLLAWPATLTAADNWQWSVGGVVAANTADVWSSWGYRELNPLLRSGNGTFGGRGLAIKSAFVGGVLLYQWLKIRKHPSAKRRFAKVNWITTGAIGGLAAGNFTVRRK